MLLSFLPFALVIAGAAALLGHEYFASDVEESVQRDELPWANNRPEIRDVSCVWTVCGEDGLVAAA